MPIRTPFPAPRGSKTVRVHLNGESAGGCPLRLLLWSRRHEATGRNWPFVQSARACHIPGPAFARQMRGWGSSACCAIPEDTRGEHSLHRSPQRCHVFDHRCA